MGTGPGSFTGLRVGLATLKTVAYVRKLPLVGVMSADALRVAAAGAGAAADAAVRAMIATREADLEVESLQNRYAKLSRAK